MKKKIALLQGGFNGEVMKYAIRGIRKRIQEEGADLYIFSCYGGEKEDLLYNQGEYQIFSLLDCNEYDGFLMASNNITSGEEREKLRKKLVASGKPAVSMEHELEGLYYVGCENYRTVKEITLHMIEKHGCRKIYFIGGPEDNYESQKRKKGVQDAMDLKGLQYEEAWFRNYNYTYHDGYQAFYDFQKMGLGVPDCVIAANDEMAIGYCTAAGEQELYAPEDFRISGFDNLRIASTYRPSLTSVERKKTETGYQSCDVLFRLINGEDVPQKTILKGEVVYRSSCGCTNHEEKHQNGKRHIIETMLNRNYVQNNFQILQKRLVQSENWNEYANTLAEHVINNIPCSAMYILLNRTEQLEQHTGQILNNQEYDSKLIVIFALEKGKLVEYKELFDISKLIPGEEEDDEKSHAYMIMPVHFQEKTIGYCVLKDSFQMIDDESLFSGSHCINMSMQVMIERLALKQMNRMLDELSAEDAMTGVYNRFALSRHAEKILQYDRLEQRETLILFSDINRLKMINDTYGHKNGDIAITTVANVLKKVCPKQSVVVRYGGDEFVIVVSGGDYNKGISIKQAIHEELKQANEILDIPFQISTSVGWVCAKPDEKLLLEEYVKQADKVMYQEKKKTR